MNKYEYEFYLKEKYPEIISHDCRIVMDNIVNFITTNYPNFKIKKCIKIFSDNYFKVFFNEKKFFYISYRDFLFDGLIRSRIKLKYKTIETEDNEFNSNDIKEFIEAVLKIASN